MTITEFEEAQTLIIKLKKYNKLMKILTSKSVEIASRDTGDKVELIDTEMYKFSLMHELKSKIEDTKNKLKNDYHIEDAWKII